MPLAPRQQLDQLAEGSFVDRGANALAFGLPGTGETHALCHRLVESGRPVLCVPAYRLVQELLAAKQGLDLPQRLQKLDNFDFLVLDDLGYLPQGAEESKVLFTLIADSTSGGPRASPPTWSSQSGSASSPTPWHGHRCGHRPGGASFRNHGIRCSKVPDRCRTATWSG